MNYWKLPLSDLSLVKVIVKVYKQDSWYTLQSWKRSFLSTGSGFSICTCSFCKTFPQPAFEWSQKLYPLAQYAVEVPVKLRYNIGSCCETSQWRFSSRQPSYSENKPQRLNIWSSCLRREKFNYKWNPLKTLRDTVCYKYIVFISKRVSWLAHSILSVTSSAWRRIRCFIYLHAFGYSLQSPHLPPPTRKKAIAVAVQVNHNRLPDENV